MRNLRQLFVAFLLLFVATTTMAQSQSDNTDDNTTTAVRADVNGDGVVNEADIAEIIAIMKNAGGIAEQPKYYWYAGWTEPTAENIAELVDKQLPTNTEMTTFTNAGKTSTTTSGVTFDLLTTRLVDDEYPTTKVKRNYYIVVPNGQGIYDSLGTALHLDKAFASSIGTFLNHTIYKSRDAYVSISAIIIK